jgi:hypothetical protein
MIIYILVFTVSLILLTVSFKIGEAEKQRHAREMNRIHQEMEDIERRRQHMEHESRRITIK